MTEFILILVAYLLGSVPFGLILARLFGGTDLRKVGSGGTGATNAGRVLGTGGFVAVWLLDMGKAMLSVWLGLMFVGDNFGAFLGLIAIIGHCFPIWLQFRGGKGVSALFGSVIMINPFIFMVSGIEWLIVATITGYSSLGAIVCFFVMGFLGFAISPAIGAIVSAAAAVCLFQHRENIRRLLNGTESKIKNVRKLAIGLFIIGVILVGVSLLCYV